MAGERPYEVVRVTLPADLFQALQDLAQREDRSVEQQAKRLIRAGVELNLRSHHG